MYIFKSFVSLQTKREGPARQMTRYAPILRDENLGNFQCKADISRRIERLTRLCVGLCSIFLYQVFLGPSSRNWQGSPALLLWMKVKDFDRKPITKSKFVIMKTLLSLKII